jgi:hypothetical protein
MASQEPQTLTERLEAGSDKYLTLAELFLVLALAVALIVLAVLAVSWIICGRLEPQQQRLTLFLRTLNENWKAFLILAVPLFYRTIRKFLARVTKLPGGVEVGQEEDERAKAEQLPRKPNPPGGTT